MKTVLFLSANQPGKVWLDVDREVRRVSQAIDDGPLGASLRFRNRPAVQVTDLGPALVADQPVVVHFSGHGGPGGRLALYDQNDEPRDVDPRVIASVFGSGGVQLVVLNACFSEPLAKALVEEGVQFVVGAVDKVPDDAALAFSEVLYRVLAHGAPLRTAFDQAVGAAGLQRQGDHGYRLVTQPGADPARWKLVEPRARDERPPVQVVLVLDVYGAGPPPPLPDRRRDRIELVLSAGAVPFPRLEPRQDQRSVDWRALGNAVEDLAVRLRNALAKYPDDPVDYYVCGNAPLPVYAHVGHLLSAWTNRITTFNYHKGEEALRALPLGAPARSAPLFTRRGLDHPSSATGRVAVYVSAGREPDPTIDDKIRAHVRDRGEHLAGIVGLTTTEFLDEWNTGSCARELVDVLSHQLPSVYPSAGGVDLFVAGPVTLALCAGRAVNPNQLDLAVSNYVGGEYTPAIRLPWLRGRGAPPPMDDKSLLERRTILEEVRDALATLNAKLDPKHIHIPAGLRRTEDEEDRIRASLKSRLARLQVEREPTDGAFGLNAPQGKISFGHAFLEALRAAPADTRARLSRLFLLHELYHYDQGINSTNYRGAGRAELILEEVDYWADAFALLTCVGWEIDRGGADAAERCSELLVQNLDAHLDALALFDQMEHGAVLVDLPVRRIRRYLIWHLQRARARTITHPDQVPLLLGSRLFVELAPIDARGESPQMFVAMDGRMSRDFRSPGNFEPADVLEAIRKGGDQGRTAIERAMDFVVAANVALLAPWAS